MPENSAFNIPHSPVAALGTVVVLIALLVAAYGAATGFVGNAQHRRRLVNSSVYSVYGLFAVMLLASSLMIYAFLTHDYTIKYVARYSDTTMPFWYKFTAYWGGLDGSLMFWVAVLSAFSAVAVFVNRERHRDMIGYVAGTILLVQLFFLAILVYNKNPFATFLTEPPLDGEGLSPLLQNYWMVIHPPSLYLGYVAATIPFAFGIGALASGRLDDRWLSSIRSWMFICWFFLSFGLILGGRWAYEELGWGGYWAWDPVENAGLIPWFTASAFLHSIMIQEQRGMLKVWNVVLVIFTFFLTIVGTFMTRSGIVQSVHAFGQDNELALLFVLFMALIAVASMGLVIYRLPQLRSTGSFESFMSREYAFLVNNWVLLGCSVFVLFATLFPTVSEAFTGERTTLGPEFFNKWMIPPGLALLFLAGAAPLLAWRRTTRDRLYNQFLIPVAAFTLVIGVLALVWPVTLVRTSVLSDTIALPISLINFGLVAFVFASVTQELYKGTRTRMRQSGSGALTALLGLLVLKRRRYGGYIVHAGVAVMFLGFAGKAYEAMEDFTVNPGETFQIREYSLVYKDLQVTANDHMREVMAPVDLYSGGTKIDTLHPSKRFYMKSDEPTTEVSMHHRAKEDVYVILTGYEERTKVVNFRVYVNPLINWVWLGFGILALGTAISLLPKRVAEELRPRRRSGPGTSAALVLVAALGAGLALGGEALAQAGPPAEHADQRDVGRPGHNDGAGAAHVCRPQSDVATKAMKELICLCGGCKRENLYECRCGYAAQERCKVNELLASSEISKMPPEQAYEAVLAAFITEYGGEHVLSTPRNPFTWIVPYVAIGGGLILIFGLGRRWVRRGRDAVLAQGSATKPEDEEYAEMLDDELRDQD